MNRKTYKIVSMIAFAVSVIGFVSFLGGVKSVNIGAFVFTPLISGTFFWLYKK